MPFFDRNRSRKVYPVNRQMPQPPRLSPGEQGPVGPQGDPGTCSAVIVVDSGTFLSDGSGVMTIASEGIASQYLVVFCVANATNQGKTPFVIGVNPFVDFTVSLTPGDTSSYYYIVLGYIIS